MDDLDSLLIGKQESWNIRTSQYVMEILLISVIPVILARFDLNY